MTLRRRLNIIAGKHYVLDGECWVWTGKLNRAGYGIANGPLRKLHGLAHRAAYIDAGHDLQPGVHLHHRCKNKACVNPTHLEETCARDHLALHKQEDSPLTWDDVREIRRRAGEGEFPTALMVEFGISRQSIGQIIINHSWIDAAYTPPAIERTCARPDCAKPFVATRSTKRFCSSYCRNLHNNRQQFGYYARRAA